MIKTIFLSVFNPKRIPKETVEAQIVKYGWIFILIRWAYYSIVFSFFRDYQYNWTPFFKPPFGLTIETYAFWQSRLAMPFGFFLILTMAFGLFIFLGLKGRIFASVLKIFNILGIAYFVPFVILQPLDKIIINTFGWTPLIIIPLHSIVLVWEALVAVILIDKIYPLKLREKIVGVFLQTVIWIMLNVLFWR